MRAMMLRKLSDPQRDVRDQVRHVRGLVLIRTLLEERGASVSELAECDSVIAVSRRELTELAARAYAPAA